MNILLRASAILSVILFFSAVSVSAQNLQGDLSYSYRTFRNNYFIGHQQVASETFMEKLGENPQALKKFKSGRSLQVAGDIVGGIGAFCVGFDLGTRLGGGKGNVALLAGGGGVMVGGIIMMITGRNKMNNALTLYKNGKTNLGFNLGDSGVGLCLNF